MSYEIPQQVQYHEKIIWGLTMKQSAIAFAFGIPALFILVKMHAQLAVRIAIAVLLSGIGAVFMFTTIVQKVRDIIAFHGFKQATLREKRMKDFLKLAAVNKDCLEIWNKKVDEKAPATKVALLSVEPVNFLIKPEEERNAIMIGFQKFLNALDFPVQILMYTDELDLAKYGEELNARAEQVSKQSNNEKYIELSKSHTEHLEKLMRERIPANRRFLLCIPEGKAGIDTQVSIVQEHLKNLGLKSTRVGNRKLIYAMIRFVNNPNGRAALLQKEKTIYTITHPENVSNHSDHLLVNKTYCRIIVATGYPRMVHEGFLDKIITAPGNFDLSIHIEPFPIEQTLVMLNKELQKQRADLYAAQKNNKYLPSLEVQYEDTKAVLDDIQKGEEKLFNISVYLNVKAGTLEELDAETKRLEAYLNSVLITPKISTFRMPAAYRSVLPYARNELAIKRNITTKALSAFFPFTSQFLILEKGGVFLGLNKNKLPIIKDIFNLSNANGAILATSGSGKSYTAKLLISRYLLTGAKVIVIDPQNEYTKLTKKYGGSVITISRKSKTIINPLDLLNHGYAEKRLALVDLFQLIFGELNDYQKAILDKAVSKTYANSGITEKRYWKIIPPKLEDLFKTLESMERSAEGFEKATFTSLLTRLGMYVDGVFSFLNKQTKLKVKKQFITFNLGDMPKQVKPIMMFLILDYVYAKMRQDKERKLLVIDEAWSLLSRAEEEGYIFEIVKTCRKFNMGLLLITQDVADLVNSKAGRAVLSNSSYTILFRQKPSVIASIKETFSLSDAEREHLLTAGVGEGLLLMENDHQELRVIASSEEHKLITTKPDEILLPNTEETSDMPLDAKKLIAELFPLQDVYKVSMLDPIQNEYLSRLRNPTFVARSLSHPFVRNPGRYQVRMRGNESPDHVSVAWWIYEEAAHYTSTARRIYSKKDEINPDVTFVNEGKLLIAIEVETGSNYKFNLEYLDQKIAKLRVLYPGQFAIFLTKSAYLPRYQKRYPDVPIYLRRHLGGFFKQHFPSARPPPLNTTTSNYTQTIDDKKEPVKLNPQEFS